MDAQTRKREIEQVMSKPANQSMTGIPLKYRGETKSTIVWKIPLSLLIYNKYNGRIGTVVQSYEVQNGKLDPENEKDQAIIENFLYDSKPDRNEKTMDNLLKSGQRQYGIVTSDGIVVDGNRRAMLLNKLFRERDQNKLEYSQVQHCQYFLAIVLPEDATEKDIQQLETEYQMGEDSKLEYNALEKYLKCKDLQKYYSIKDIASFMGEKEGTIKSWLSILSLMEEYLESYGYKGIYTRLDKTEGQFVDLEGYLKAYKERKSTTKNVNWPYQDSDLADLKVVCFDYIRARYEGKQFRDIAKTGTEGSIFSDREIWSKFFMEHSNNVPLDEYEVNELREKHPHDDLSKLLRSRDVDWTKAAKDVLESNLKEGTDRLEDKRYSENPIKLLRRSLNALESVDIENNSFLKDSDVKQKLEEIYMLSSEMLELLEKE